MGLSTFHNSNSSDGAAGDRFGAAVALRGNTLVVSAERDDDNGTDSGSLYFYERRKH